MFCETDLNEYLVNVNSSKLNDLLIVTSYALDMNCDVSLIYMPFPSVNILIDQDEFCQK